MPDTVPATGYDGFLKRVLAGRITLDVIVLSIYEILKNKKKKQRQTFARSVISDRAFGIRRKKNNRSFPPCLCSRVKRKNYKRVGNAHSASALTCRLLNVF